MNFLKVGSASLTMSVQQQEEQLRLAIDAAEVGLWDVDVATGTLYWPARVKAMFGISPDAIATLDDFVTGLHSEDAPEVLRAFAHAQDSALRTVYDVEYRTVGKEDGVIRWLAAKGRGLFDSNGLCIRAIGTAIDITHRKEAELLQKRTQQRLDVLHRIEKATRPLVDAVEVMTVTTRLLGEHLGATRCAYADVEGDGDRFTIRSDWSPGVPSSVGAYSLDLFGSRASSSLRNGRHLVVCDVDKELEDDNGGRMFNAIGIKAIVCAGLVKGGQLLAMMAVHQAVPRQWTDEDLVLITDVVERCWAHIERVRHAAMLREQDRRKDEFLVTLAHELRNPIAPMLYAIALLKRDKDPLRQSQRLEVIERQAAHMVRLVDDLLDVSRISRGVVELKREPVDIAPLLVQAVEAATPGLEAGRHRFSLDLPAQPTVVNADAARVVQIVTNLLTNAAKYTPDGGDIRLSADVKGSVAAVEVVDSGLGIPQEDQPRVFDLFTQLSHTGQIKHGGLGIGLSLVKRLVEMHDGKVYVQSAGLNQGSTFRIELPLAAAATVLPETDTDTPSIVRSGRVLVVEDNVDGLRMLVELLEAKGLAVAGAADGPEALRMAKEWKPALVLLDLGLPGIDGYEVAARLREDFGLVMRIVALTGWGTEQDRARTAAAGFYAHITKPIAPAKLLELVEKWLHLEV